MFIQGVIRRSPSQTGIRPAHPSFGRFRALYDAEILCVLPGLAIALKHHPLSFNTTAHCIQYSPLATSIRIYNVYTCQIVYVDVVLQDILGYSKLSAVRSLLELRTFCESPGSLVVIVVTPTVCALHAGTLATIWTAAPSLPQRPSVQLAAVCLFLATLTIAARCYASSNATHSLVQFNSRPSSFRPIDNSNAQVPHSSNLVLSRLLPTSYQPVQSDTRIILTNSKTLLRNQNSNSARRKRFRTKRDLDLYYNHHDTQTIYKQVPPTRTSLGINVLLLKSVPRFLKRSEVPNETKNSSVVSDSDSGNSTLDVKSSDSDHQNDSSFQEEETPSAQSGNKARPMPPVHDQGNPSCKQYFV